MQDGQEELTDFIDNFTRQLSMTEQQFQTKLIKWLFDNKIFAFKVVNATTAGHTDITACINGVFVGIEVKAENGTVSPLQEYTHKRLLKSGGVVIVVRPSQFDEFKNFMTDMKKTASIKLPIKPKKGENSDKV